MFSFNRTKRRWKAAAEDALSPRGLQAEAEQLAGEIAQQVWLLNGGAAWADALTEGGVLTLQTLAMSLIAPEVIVFSAALRHLSALEYAVQAGDYEDVAAVREELEWVKELLASKLNQSTVAVGAHGAEPSATARHEALRQELAATLGQRLLLALAAA